MSHPRRFRFGVEMVGPFDGLTWAESARELEQLGYSTLFVPDHLHEGLGPITAMATAVAATTSLVVAPMVFATDFRHPAVLARELASIDLLSDGRLEVEVPGDNRRWLVGWVLSFGGDAVVVRPEWAIRSVAEAATRSLE